LQVEHPVTEMVTGIDLVEMQLEITVGNVLPFKQDDITFSGHAIELRICAEDTDADFVPATGKINLLRDASGEGIRLDSSLIEGMTVTSAFDPMLAKLIVFGSDRDVAIANARQAISEQVILGVTTNCAFLGRVLAHAAFKSGDVHTHFIEQHKPDLQRAQPDDQLVATLVAIAACNDPEFQRLTFDTPEPHATIGAWRNV